MTNEEAIKDIKQLLRWYLKEEPMSETVYKREAVEMAIKALEQQPSLKDRLEKEYLVESLKEDLQKLYAENEELHKKLEQQPSEDCISRKAALRHRHIIHDDDGIGYSVVRVDEIIDLPPVKPKPKTGYWIYTPKRRLVDETDEGGVYITDYRCTCSECGGDFGFQKMSDAYCKYCGAEMIGGVEE